MKIAKAARYTCAIVVAAGSSQRMGRDKLWMQVSGISVIERSLLAFENADTVDAVVVVTRPDLIAPLGQAVTRRKLAKVCSIVAGGDCRQRSVAAGLAAVPQQTEFVSIHDGARPLVRVQDIDEVNRQAWRCGAAALAVPAKDTVKVADQNGVVVQTPERSSLWQVQTPQVFDRVQFAEAMAIAEKNGWQLTDDCQVMEKAGRPVQLCKGAYSNIKITTPEDVYIAEALLKGEKA